MASKAIKPIRVTQESKVRAMLIVATIADMVRWGIVPASAFRIRTERHT